MLETIKQIVLAAARLMTDGQFAVKTKDSPANLVTDKDVAVEQFLKEALEKAIPHIGFVGEEEPAQSGALQAEYTAVVDPIDGTMNFVRGIPLSVISVAVLKQGMPYIGVVYNPYTSELFYAKRGGGAYLCGRPILRLREAARRSLLFYRVEFVQKRIRRALLRSMPGYLLRDRGHTAAWRLRT